LKTWGVDGGVDVLAEKRSSIDGFLLEFKEDTRDWTANARKELRIGWLMGNRLERLGSDSCVHCHRDVDGVRYCVDSVADTRFILFANI
jgi:hypothetical protein